MIESDLELRGSDLEFQRGDLEFRGWGVILNYGGVINCELIKFRGKVNKERV